MPERSSKSQRLQLGWETVYGTAVAATKRMLSLSVDLDPQATRKKNFAQGYNFPSSTSMEKDFTEGSISGAPMFDELHYLIQLALGQVTPTVGTPATAQTWVWNVPLFGDITPRSATVERGDTSTAEKVPGIIATGLSFAWNRNEITANADVMGQIMDVAATLTTAGITTLPQIPLNPNGVGVFLDTTSAGLGTTRMLRAFQGGFDLGDLFGQIWPLNELKASFDGFVSQQPSSSSTLTLMADTAGKALLTSLRAGDRRFLRIYVKGPQIGAGPATYLFQVDMAVEVVDVDAFSDQDGIYAIPLTFAPVADEAWGSAVKITLVNTQSA